MLTFNKPCANRTATTTQHVAIITPTTILGVRQLEPDPDRSSVCPQPEQFEISCGLLTHEIETCQEDAHLA
jgi:hypothetical protein